MRRAVVLGSVWAVGAVVATTIAWSAVGLVGEQVTDGREAALSTDDIDAALDAGSATPSPSARPSPSRLSPPPSSRPTVVPRAVDRTFPMTGGTVAVSCSGTTIRLIYATPRGGYASTVERAGPDEVEARFRSEAHESKLEVRCSGGRPVGEVEEKAR